MICDIRLASENAQFAASEIKLGWIGGGGMSAFLAHSAGREQRGPHADDRRPDRRLDGARLGSGQRGASARTPCCRGRESSPPSIASRAPIAAETAKANLRAAYTMPFDQAMRYERDLQTICFATDDAAEGRAAFAEKRPARFHGR